MKPIVTIAGPSQAGPGERELMLAAAHKALEQLNASGVVRIDVPAKGSGDEAADSGLRASVAPAIPALQSGSLFGGATGALVVDAQQLLKAEAEVLAELVESAARSGDTVAVFVSGGAVPAPLGKLLKSIGETVKVDRVNERSAAKWLSDAARARGLRLDSGSVDALVLRFGTDLGALGGALDQLAVDGERVTAEAVRARFKNRPDEPMWYYADAVVAGNTGEALRRLEDFLIHGHPLQLLAFLQNDLRRRALAAAAPDYETFVERDGGRAGWALEKVWKARGRMRATDLKRALAALAKADLQLKTAPEATHRVTVERLTVALSLWYGGRA